MDNFLSVKNLVVYILTSAHEGKHYGMAATWVTPASLRLDEVRFTVALSKFNDSTAAIRATKKFLLQILPNNEARTAFRMGVLHSNEGGKFEDEAFTETDSGHRRLNHAIASNEAQVISELETEDRFILYCRMSPIKNTSNLEPLTHQCLFNQLSDSELAQLDQKFKQNSAQDAGLKDA